MGHHGRQRTGLMLVRAKTLEVKRDGTIVVDMSRQRQQISPGIFGNIFSYNTCITFTL